MDKDYKLVMDYKLVKDKLLEYFKPPKKNMSTVATFSVE